MFESHLHPDVDHVIRKVENIIREEMMRAGAVELLASSPAVAEGGHDAFQD